MLTKEQIDKQKSGQSSVSPFMNVNQQSPKKSSKNVSFSAMETIQKQGDSIDKLTSLMNELSTKLDKRENTAQYKPRIYQGRNRGHGQRQSRYGSRNRSYSRKQGPYNSSTSRRSYQNNNNYSGRNYRPRNTNNNGEYQTNYSYNDRSSYRRENFNQNYGQRDRNRSVSRERDRSRPRYRSTS